MAQTERRIAFSAQDSGVRSLMDEMKRKGQEVSIDMIRQVQDQTRHIEDQNEALKEQIRLLEERKKSGGVGGGPGTAGPLGDGGGSPIPVIDELAIDVLREIVDTLKQGQKKDDRREGEDRTEDERKDDEKKRDDEKQRSVWKDVALGTVIGNWVSKLPDRAAQLATSGSEYHLGASLVSMVPLVGGAISQVMMKAYDSAQKQQLAQGNLSGLTGFGNAAFKEFGRGMEPYGFSPAEYMDIQAQMAKARGSYALSGQAALNYAVLNQGFGLESGTITNLTRNLRGDRSEMSTTQLVSYLAKVTGMKSEDTSLLEEFVEVVSSLSQDQLTRLDSIDMGINTKMIGALSKYGGSFSNPQVLRGIIQTLDQGLRAPQTPYAQALSFHLLGQAAPGASRVDLLRMQEEGISNPTYLKSMLDFLKGVTFTEDAMVEQVKGLFPQLSISHSQRLVQGYIQKGFVPSQEEMGLWTQEEMQGRAQAGVGDLEESLKRFEGNFARAGQSLEDAANQIKEAFTGDEGFLDALDKVKGSLSSFADAMSEIAGN